MNKIYVNKEKKLEITNGIAMGFKNPKEIKFQIVDNLTFEETLDLFNTVQLELLEAFYATGANKLKTDEEKAKLRRDMHTRASFGFALVADRFDPTAKDARFDGKTDMEVLQELDKRLQLAKKTHPNGTPKRIPEV